MLDRIGNVASAPSVDLMGKLSVRALDSLPLPLLIILFVACLALINIPTPNQSILPTYSPPLSASEKDRLSPYTSFPSNPRHGQFDTGVLTTSPQYVAVVATGRRSSRFRDWRGTSLDDVEEVDEKREELC